MNKKHSHGLNELMIVNPGRPGSEEMIAIDHVFLGADGQMYQMQGFNRGQGVVNPGQYLLGEDGTLYQVLG